MMRTAVSVIGMAMLALTSGTAEAQTASDRFIGGWGAGHMMFGGFMMVVFWGGLALVIVLVARQLGGPQRGQGRELPLEILQARYARGDIDKAEYEERRKTLSA